MINLCEGLSSDGVGRWCRVILTKDFVERNPSRISQNLLRVENKFEFCLLISFFVSTVSVFN
jgi:hypothetical protein